MSLKPVQTIRDGIDQLPFGANIVQDQKKHHLQYRRRRYGSVAFNTIPILDLFVDEVKVNEFINGPEDLFGCAFQDGLQRRIIYSEPLVVGPSC